MPKKENQRPSDEAYISPFFSLAGWEEQGRREDRRILWGGVRLRRMDCGAQNLSQIVFLILAGGLVLMGVDLGTAKGSPPALALFWGPVVGLGLLFAAFGLFRAARKRGR